jgi:hypothetical protein
VGIGSKDIGKNKMFYPWIILVGTEEFFVAGKSDIM